MNAKDGSPKWVFGTGFEIDSSPNFFGNAVLITSQDGALYSVDAATGQQLWKYETGDQLQCGATIAGDRTFLGGCDAHLHVVNVKSGEAIGQPVPLDAPTGSTPSVLANRVFVPTYAGEIFAFEMPEASTVWRFSDREMADEFKNSVAVKDGLVVAASRSRRVFALDAATGQVKWVNVLRKRVEASPIIAGPSVFVATTDGNIIRYDLQTGDEQWSFQVKGAFIGPPAAADGRLVLTSDRGTVFCFGS